jgi:hypothetical protein
MCEYNEDLYGPRHCPDDLIQVDYEKLTQLRLSINREMVCFTARVIYPLHDRSDINKDDEETFHHLIKHFTRSNLIPVESTNPTQKWYDVILCENDVCDFLNYLRYPFYLDYIDYKYAPHRRLYTNRRIKHDTQLYPRTPEENHIYWKAIYTERNMM